MQPSGAHHANPPSSRQRGVGVRRRRGFTLVELMITIFVAAILITIAIPSFQHVIASTKLTTASNSVVNALHVARMQAIKRNADAQFCGNSSSANGASTLGAACGAQGGAVYVLETTATGTTAAVQVHAAPTLSDGAQHIHSITPVTFDATGVAHAIGSTAPYGGTVADICTTTLSSNNHRVITMTTGTIIATASTSAGSCP